MKNKQHYSPRSVIAVVVSIVLVLVVMGYAAGSLVAYNILNRPGQYNASEVPSVPYEDVTFPSRGQNYLVHAFYVRGESGMPAIISVHGYRGSRHDRHQLDKANTLRSLGYTVITVDLQDNGGDTHEDGRLSMGYKERWDVLGAFDYLLTRGFTSDRIGLFGESMGASTVMMAAGAEPRLKTIWEDSGYSSAYAVLSEQASNFGASPIFVPGGMLWGVVLGGDRVWDVTPIAYAADFAKNHQVIYIVHDEPDEVVEFHHGVDLNAAFRAAGVDVTFWDVPDGKHDAAWDNYHAEYVRRLDMFFKTHLVVGV